MTDTTTTRRLRRSTSDRTLGGVAGGLGQYFGVDPVLIRVAFVLALFAGGAGLLAYLVAWIVVPEDDGTEDTSGAPPPRDAATVGGVILVVLAAAILFDGWWSTGDLILPLLLVGTGAWLLLRDDDRDEPRADQTVEAPERMPVSVGATASVPPPPPGPRTPDAPPPAPSGPPTGRITLGIVALLAGGFGIAYAAGAGPSVETVLLSCLAVTGVGLLVGAFTGRARGLIALAVPLVVALSLVSAVDIPLSGGFGERRYEPDTLGELDAAYELGAGSLVLDLRGLSASELAGAAGTTSVEIRLGVGEVRILTPPDVTVRTDVEVTAGQVDLYGDLDDGTDLDVRDERRSAMDGAVLELLVDVGFGEVTVR